jgi:hypothetical protein
MVTYFRSMLYTSLVVLIVNDWIILVEMSYHSMKSYHNYHAMLDLKNEYWAMKISGCSSHVNTITFVITGMIALCHQCITAIYIV